MDGDGVLGQGGEEILVRAIVAERHDARRVGLRLQHALHHLPLVDPLGPHLDHAMAEQHLAHLVRHRLGHQLLEPLGLPGAEVGIDATPVPGERLGLLLQPCAGRLLHHARHELADALAPSHLAAGDAAPRIAAVARPDPVLGVQADVEVPEPASERLPVAATEHVHGGAGPPGERAQQVAQCPVGRGELRHGGERHEGPIVIEEQHQALRRRDALGEAVELER